MKTRFLSAALAAMLVPAAAPAQNLVGGSLPTSEETTFPAQTNWPGLFQAQFMTGKFDKTSDIMAADTLTRAAGPIMANTTDSASDFDGNSWEWGDNTMFGYIGEIWVESGTTYTFGKSVDDWTFIVVSGKTIIENSTWDSFQTGTYTAGTTGWVPIEIRIGNRDGGHGVAKGARWGIAFNTVGDVSWDHFRTGTDGWQALLDPGNGSLLRTGFYKGIRIVSHVRANDPTVIDVNYAAYTDPGTMPTVNVRALAFEDGERSFWKVVRPETFIDGTAANIGDNIAANVEHTISWKVSSDWDADLAKVKFEVLTSEQGQLPLDWVTIPCANGVPDISVTYNSQTDADVLNALFWYYACGVNDLTIDDGYLKNTNGVTLVSRTTVSDKFAAIEYIADKMELEQFGYSSLYHYAVQSLRTCFPSSWQVLCAKGTNTLEGSRFIGEKSYCVIDVSGGPNADSYPITYLDFAPISGWSDEYKTTKILLRRIEPGSVMLGGTKPVTLTKPFYIGVFEVTQKQYQLVTGTTPSEYKGAMRPVENVSYDMIRGSSLGAGWPTSSDVDPSSFLGVLQAKTGLVFDLPTESQWEYACRAGTMSTYNNGGSSLDDLKLLGRYSQNGDDGRGGYSIWHTTVGSYSPNAWGLYDMHGNVQEWCLDWSDYLNHDPAIDYPGPSSSSGLSRVFRGGDWGGAPGWDGSSSQGYKVYGVTGGNGLPFFKGDFVGFRLARTLSTN